MKKVSILIPVFNEEQNVKIIFKEIAELDIKDYEIEVIFVNDGSEDRSMSEIKELYSKNQNIKYINFTRNFGHQSAIKAGLDLIHADAIIMMDGDLQHPPSLIIKMLEEWCKGSKVVQALCNDNKGAGFFKKISRQIFYKFLALLNDEDLSINSADFRLLDNEVLQTLKSLKESDLFIRGLVSWTGHKTSYISYTAPKRIHGKSSYNPFKMIQLALSGISSFSTKPLQLVFTSGLIIFGLSLIYSTYSLINFFFFHKVVQGWTSLILCILLLGGLQIMFIGIIGIYLGKAVKEVKSRPNYVIKEMNI